MGTNRPMKVKTHVGRDLLHAAASFKTDYAVVWEYVVNSLQYVEDGAAPKVQVLVRPKQSAIEICDNGRGMDQFDLTNYFTMHGENVDRLRGRGGRGKFGTGKSAAFGIGRSLTVETRRAGVTNVVHLTRATIDASSGEDIPLDWKVRNQPTSQPNGTSVLIEDIALQRINIPAIIEYIERHLQAFRLLHPEVAVNDHVCQYREPPVIESSVFLPSVEQAKVLGNVRLTVKVSPAPLPLSEVGIAVSAGVGNLVAIESAGMDRKELGNYLFGEIDVPALETTVTTIAPYDSTRSLQLNPQHPVCLVLVPFIGAKLEEVRLAQLRKLADARRSEQARRLTSEAQKIASILNDDFREVMSRLEGIKAVAAYSGSAGARFGSTANAASDAGIWLEGMAEPGSVDVPAPKPAVETLSGQKRGRPAPDISKMGTPDPSGGQAVDKAGGTGESRRPRGGFRVEYRDLGDNRDRSMYDRTTLTILINLSHPAVLNALHKGGPEDPNFKRLSYEIAFTEYSIALGRELVERDPDYPADDLLFEVRSTLNRVSASAASLYA